MDISVIICTHNRAESLDRTLQGCCRLIIPSGLTWELLVLDNRSTDSTAQVCQLFASTLPLRYLFESTLGKSHALNRAVRSAGGQLLLFTDDDVDLDPHWLAALWRASQRHPQAFFFGGKTLARWETTPPDWLQKNLELLPYSMDGSAAGDQEQTSSTDAPLKIIGCNMAVRRSLFEQGFRYPTELGPCGQDSTVQGNVRGEESALIRSLYQAGHHAAYIPTAVVHHRNGRHRMSENFLRQFFRGAGMERARRDRFTQQRRLFGAPLFAWRELIRQTIKFLGTRWTCGSTLWVKAEIEMAYYQGLILEARRQVAPPSTHGPT